MMRILFWSCTFWPNIGGVEVSAAMLLPALRKRGFEFVVVTPKSPADLPDEGHYDGFPIYRFAFRNHLSARSIDDVIATKQRLAALKRAFAPDLIHINCVGLDNFFHLATINAHQAPILVTLHGKWSERVDTVVAETLRSAHWVAGCSSAILEYGRKLVPEIISRSSVIHNGVEPFCAPAPLPFQPPRLLCLGRLVPEKGFDLALIAFLTVLNRFPTAQLVIVGDGPEKKSLEMQALDQGIHHSVHFAGWLAPNKVTELMNSSTMVLLPSRQESFPLVALEAAAMARPVVVSSVGGLPEIVLHGQTGLIVENENSDRLADAILFLLQHPAVAAQMGQKARDRVQAEFSWKTQVDAYDRLYRTMVYGAISTSAASSSA